MEKFVVSARKYRPARFVDVVGQESVTITLKNAIKSGALAHSFLFCGPRGVGKTTCARILAKTINCQNLGADFEACNTCEACQSFNNNSSFNVHELDAASNNSVDDIRSLVEQVRFAPQSGKYKIYIIDEVHMLSTAAFNAFLKTLEEPPSYAIFILATTEKHKIIPTILSRCQIFDFNRITIDDIVQHLQGICAKEGIAADNDALHVVAQKADGALRDALSMFDRLVDHTTNTITFANVITSLNILDYDYYFKVTDYLLSQDQTSLFLLFDQVVRHGFEGDHFIGGLMDHFRNLMVSKDPKTISILEVSGELKQRYKQQAEQIPNSFLLNALNIAGACEISYKTSKNHRLHVELALLKMCYLTTVMKPSPEAIAAEVKKNSDSDPIAYKTVAPEVKLVEEPRPVIAAQTPTPPPVPQPEVKAAEPVAPIESIPPKAEAPKPEPAIDMPKKSLLGGGSASVTGLKLGDIGKEQPKKPVVNDDPGQPQAVVHIEPDELQKAWQVYIQKMQQERISVYSVMKDINPIVEKDTVIVVVNQITAELFTTERDRLVEFLKDQMNLPRVNLEMRIEKANPDDKNRKAFTPKEKYEKMREKNPAVDSLQNKLGLKLDY